MNGTAIEKREKGGITGWFRCSRCPVETDRGYRVRIRGVQETLCRGCFEELLEKRRTAAAAAAAARRGG